MGVLVTYLSKKKKTFSFIKESKIFSRFTIILQNPSFFKDENKINHVSFEKNGVIDLIKGHVAYGH